MDKCRIILGGLGGQGIILSGIILAEAAVMDGKYAVQTQNYGPESRGGASRCDVIISDSQIFYPRVSLADVFLALSQEAFEKYLKYTNNSTSIIIDESISDYGLKKITKFDIIKYAYNNLKKPFTVNMISLGILNGLKNIVSQDSMKTAIKNRVPKGTFDINFSAYERGYNMTING